MEDNFKKIAEEADSKDLDIFYRDNCESCGSQRCTGVYDEEWREECELYKKEFCK